MKATILLLSVDEAPMLEYSLPAAVAQAGASVAWSWSTTPPATARRRWRSATGPA